MVVDTIALLLVVFLFGYCLGKRLGREIGLEEGKAIAPIILREQSYERGYCALCSTPRSNRHSEGE